MKEDLISREALKEHKFCGVKFVQFGGRTNGKTLESINKAYRQGWNDCIDAIVDNAPTVKPTLKLEDITEDDVKRFAMIWQRATSKGLILETDRPRGKWGEVFHHQGWNYHKCSNCHLSMKLSDYENFCPNCGADMREEAADD